MSRMFYVSYRTARMGTALAYCLLGFGFLLGGMAVLNSPFYFVVPLQDCVTK